MQKIINSCFLYKREPPCHCCNAQSDLSLGRKKNKEMMEEQKDCSEQSEIWEIIVNFLGFFNISVHFFVAFLVTKVRTRGIRTRFLCLFFLQVEANDGRSHLPSPSSHSHFKPKYVSSSPLSAECEKMLHAKKGGKK